ncbi:MAG TPA: SPOR domain-containing protein [Devosia sp.]|nr:SPOR domain-containing protein [Devosia sp.]
MSDPGDKSDDLISELARLMASSATGGESLVKPIARPAPLNPEATSPAPIRIPGMDTPLPVSTVPASAPILTPEPPRAPATGTIRIPGMDQPAPVTTSAPVAKFDFGRPPSAQPIKPQAAPAVAPKVTANPAPTPAAAGPTRIPSQLQTVSENRSFGEGPAPVVLRPSVPEPVLAAQDNGFNFDFGFGQQPQQKPANDPIADLIAQELSPADPAPVPLEETRPARSVETVVPVMKTTVTPQTTPARPTISPMSAAPRQASGAPIPLKPVSVTPRPMENDRFAISPGMGLNGRPAASQPLGAPVLQPEADDSDYSDEADPMAEIESLIGEAVRVELGPGPVKVQSPVEVKAEVREDLAPAPIVPPLTAQFAPRRSALPDHDDDAGEGAILAAAQDTGAELGRLDGPMAEESPYRRLKVKPQRNAGMSGGMRQYVGMAVAGTLLLAAGLGLYWVLNMGRGTTPIEAPVLTADSTPVKVAPTPEVTPSAETTASPVMEQLNGTSAEPSAEQLVTTDETSGPDPLRVVGDTPASAAAVADPDAESGLANRKVRTVTVRPDGTIVPGDDAVAGAEELPVDRPNVPEVPGAVTETTNLLSDESFPDTASDPIGAAIDTATATPATAVPAVSSADTLIGEISAAGGFLDSTKVPPTPAHRPDYAAMAYVPPASETPTPLAAFPEDNGATDLLETAPEPVAAAPVTASNASAYVQLTSSPSQADANAQLRTQTSRYGSLFEGGSLIVQSADLGQKGTWYRVRLPVSSLSEANRICASIKAAGGDCIATGG